MYLIIFAIFIAFGYAVAKSTAARIVISFFLCSIAFSVLLDNMLDLYSGNVAIYSIFTSLVLFPLFLSFNYLDSRRVSFGYLPRNNKKILKVVIWLSVFGAFVNFLAVLDSISFFIDSSVDIETYKNADIGNQFIQQRNFVLYSLSASLTPFSYIALALHFYFSINKQYKLSILAFLGSLSIILEQIVTFGRGGIVAYVFCYGFMTVLIFNKIDYRFKKIFRRILIVSFLILASGFFYISIGRFQDGRAYSEMGFISNPILVSIFDYYSQWIKNGYDLFFDFNSLDMIPLSNFMYLPERFFEVFGAEKYDLGQVRMDAFGFRSTLFNGLPVLLLFDLHYAGAILFSWIYYLIFKKIIGGAKVYDWWHYCGMVFLILIPVFYFQGPIFVFASYNIGLAYFLLIYFSCKFRILRKP